jgi:hypothetical protein
MPAGTVRGSASASVRQRGPASSSIAPSGRGSSAGTTTASVLPSRPRRVPARSRPRRSSSSIFASSAEKKRSAGAPFSICSARVLEAPKSSRTRSPVWRS